MAAGFPLLLPYNLVSIYGLGSTVGQRCQNGSGTEGSVPKEHSRDS